MPSESNALDFYGMRKLLRRVKEQALTLICDIKKQKLKYVVHIKQKHTLQAKIEGRREKERPL